MSHDRQGKDEELPVGGMEFEDNIVGVFDEVRTHNTALACCAYYERVHMGACTLLSSSSLLCDRRCCVAGRCATCVRA